MMNEKIVTTQQVRKLIIDARNHAGLTASDLSKVIKDSSYWLPNIENGRTKTISKMDLIKIIITSYNCSEGEAIEKISAAINNITESSISDNTNGIDQILIYKGNDLNLEDISKFQNEFEITRDDIIKGFDIFFNKIDDKQHVLEMMNSIQKNFHSDLGFIISMLALPWCKITVLDVNDKKDFFKKLFNMITENGDCEKCKHKPKDNSNTCEDMV